ncbi:hypothetical protein BKN38_07860 [Helicobacter sp. CLO-3]|uniref:plasmid mobilization relaxosome protein MobC n=1 Tax=unclassified Helicobacter TaxID=2593540 RepID=UPI000805EA5C|nr:MULTISPECIES: plasmid mobilization relaxosome protein MobC [unclassified Helicobacter]OBV28807.1 hypothetical protein BA723_08040 [Helicobacter sp. CLO-3]OHU82058.1 hypothetical protein BKN38_07860 [Helicobacter sp. CLO-3]
MAKNSNVVVVSFSISAENAKVLNHLSKELHISKSRILDDLLNRYLQSRQHSRKLDFSPTNNEESHKIIKLSLTKNQYDLLKLAAKNSIANSVPKLIKFHALNMVYESKILNSKEIEALAITRAELNKIGVNINQIARAINSRNNNEVDPNLFKIIETLDHLDRKISHISSDIKTLCHNSQEILK